MPDIRYVCLSDLHFGAENSILSCLVDGGVTVDPSRASSVLEGFVAGLTMLIGANADQSRKPTLVLNGDVLELALASDSVALMVFELFLDRIFPANGEALFENEILYQPGNHDHHLWETTREHQYAQLLNPDAPNGAPLDQPLPIPWHGTVLYYLEDKRPVHSEVLEQLARRHHPDQGIRFRVSYPNLAVRSEDGKTVVVFHHGHYVESIYHLMTTLKHFIFPDHNPPDDVYDIEAENYAWIDFFWSTLGRSGKVGDDMGLVYDMLQSTPAIQRLAGNLATGISAKLKARKGVIGRLHWLITPILDLVLKKVAGRVAESERKSKKSDVNPQLSRDAETGLMAYLNGPLFKQLTDPKTLKGLPSPELVKFIFGHTHKPFTDTRKADPWTQPVRIFNSGGWVVDTEVVEPLHGCNLVLLDETLEVACVRLYNQDPTKANYRVGMDQGVPVEQGQFYQRLSGLIKPDEEPWKSFSASVADLVVEREEALKTIIANAQATPKLTSAQAATK